MKINKSFLKCLAAIMVLMFHIWANITNTIVESFIIRSLFVGVDIFFFLSAYSLADKEIKLSSFLKNRFLTIYLEFVVFAIISFFYKGWKIQKLINVLLGIDLIKNGGGSFLWFIPAIMIFYVLYPLFIKWNNNRKEWIVLVGYSLIAILISYFTKNKNLFIVINRIPIIIIAYYLKTRKIKFNKLQSALMMVVGVILLYFFYFKKRVDVPIVQLYYVLAIPLVLGIIYFFDDVKSNKVIDLIGNASLEIYGLSMIFGFNIASDLLKMMKMPILTNILSITIVVLISIVFKYLYDISIKKILIH